MIGHPKKILAITNNFPTSRFPEKGVFVMNILHEMASRGIVVDVIAPVSLGAELKRFFYKPKTLDFGLLNVEKPFFISIPQRFPRFRKQITKINDWLFGLSIGSSVKSSSYDVIYCHFLQSAIPVVKYLDTGDCPLLVNLGESDPWDYDHFYGKELWLDYLERFNFIVAVSKTNYDFVLSRRASFFFKMRYIPNGVNLNFFKAYDKKLAREKIGLSLDDKYVIFCGHLDERKGPLRVLEAIRGTDIKGIFLGSNGRDIPFGDEVAFIGAVENALVPFYLSAADVFVLPSRSEGMSNAVLEAISCCVPMVISDLPFNTDFIPKDAAIFVDPNDINNIRNGIMEAISDETNERFRLNLQLFRENFSVSNRIDKIFHFLES
jgi:teichuronic acid biosynthesis glycosyltransferase TuaC